MCCYVGKISKAKELGSSLASLESAPYGKVYTTFHHGRSKRKLRTTGLDLVDGV